MDFFFFVKYHFGMRWKDGVTTESFIKQFFGVGFFLVMISLPGISISIQFRFQGKENASLRTQIIWRFHD